MSTFKKISFNQTPFLFYILKNKKAFFTGAFFLVFTVIFDSAYPLLLMVAIDQIQARANSQDILHTTLQFMLVMILFASCRYLWRHFFASYYTKAAAEIRTKLYSHLLKLGPNFYNKNPVGEIMSVMTSDIGAIQSAMSSGMVVWIDSVSTIIVVICFMIYLNPIWTLKALILLPVAPFITQFITKKIYAAQKQQQESLAELYGFTQELVSGIRAVKSYARESYFLKKYNEFSSKYETANNRLSQYDAIYGPLISSIVGFSSVILFFIAIDDVIAGIASVGTLVAFQKYISKITGPISEIGLAISQMQKGKASFERIQNIFKQKTDIPNKGSILLEQFESLEIKNLNFTYSNKETPLESQKTTNPLQTKTNFELKNISFKIQKGQTVGIIGPIACGKSTLLNLIMRLMPYQSGQILINEKPIESYEIKKLFEKMILVPQENFLFSRSVQQNIIFGIPQVQDTSSKPLHPSTQNPVEYYSQMADVDHDIQLLPQQYESILGEKGVNLSGGQKQRLTLARGFYIHPEVLLLDDNLSAVDYKTEESILNNINQLNCTKLIVAHRIRQIQNADQIIVFNVQNNIGYVEAIGTHQELINKSPTYKLLNEIQSDQKEVII